MYQQVIKIDDNKNKCRTCLKLSNNLQVLTKLAFDGNAKQVSFAELLKDVTNINIEDDNLAEMPQYICGCCLRKLKSSHSFIKQAQEANEQLWVLHKNRIYHELADGLQEQEIDIQNCLEIKMENAQEMEEDMCFGNNVTEPGECQTVLKKEDIDEFSLQKGGGKINDTSKLILDDIGSESKSSEANMDFSASDNSEEDNMPLNGLKAKQKSTKADNSTAPMRNEKNQARKKKTLPKRINNEKEEDEDIAVPCPECNKIFSNSKKLNRHLRDTHVPDEQKCVCPICGAKFTRSCNMYKHMRSFHEPEKVNLLLPPKEKAYQCDKCPRKYTKKKHLNYHIREKHSKDAEKEDSKDKALEQPVAKKMNAEVRPLCFICGGSFSNKSDLIIHMRRHTGEKPFKCDLCDKAYPRLSELTVHRRIHTGDKPYKCKICEKTFRVSTKLANHMRSHTDERPYKCKHCERSFKYSKDLNIHNRIHTGERPYCCTVCGSTFTQSNSLKAHRTKLGHMEDPSIEATNGFPTPCT